MTKISNSGLRICNNFYERIFKMLQISKKLLKDKRHFIFHASFIIVDCLLILNTIKTKETKNFNLCQMKTLCSCHGYSKIIGNTKNINSQQHLNLLKKVSDFHCFFISRWVIIILRRIFIFKTVFH